MGSRLELHKVLVDILGSENVYYDPPTTMEYPAIQYNRSKIDTKKANNQTYIKTNCYTVTVIDWMPDNESIEKLLKLPMCSYDRGYVSDGLHHDVLQLYY